MNLGIVATAIFGIILISILGLIYGVRRPKKLKSERFAASWQELQGYCRDKSNWPLAITEADKLLDAALKKRKLKGKTMGERMVSAQRLFHDNDDIWFAHNLAKKIAGNADIKLKEDDVKDALFGFRQALREIGALPASNEVSNDK